jgi:hypothetical protein
VRFTRYLPIAFLALLYGCVSVQPYPQDWSTPSTATEGKCPSIAGSYANKGEGQYPQYPPNLVYQLLGQRAKWLETDRVNIALIDSKKLLVQALALGQVLSEDLLPIEKDTLSCEGGFVVLHKREFVNRDGAMGSKTSLLHIAASEGNLVIKEETTEIGMLFLIPGKSSYTTWSRYQLLK